MSLLQNKLQQKFNDEYNRLNEKQREAVDHLDGPVMVIAGPGTGKTQILSARIGKILLSDAQVEPQNILCLTYTDAGVVAMRKRLQQFIGSDAYRVNIYTFHAFCNEVIQDNLSLFEKTALDPISDLERIELLKELIDGFEKEHPLKRYRGEVYYEIQNLTSLFSLMKKEGWTGDHICQKIEEYLDDLPNREGFTYKRGYKEFKKGDLNPGKIEEQQERMQKLKAACGEFVKFQELMRRQNRYDFDDMINWVIKAFGDNQNLLRKYQEQYQYILVDEYQDTSGSQNKIVQLLIEFWDKPNVFVVGDDDQSIYRFQGANIENMLAFADGYQKDLLTVVLTNNYRSTQPILDVSKSLIDRNNERLVAKLPGLSKDLLSSREDISHFTHLPLLKEYETQQDEMIGITLAVEGLLKEGVAGNTIGIIYRENKYGEALADYLRLKGLPFYSKKNLNILEQPIIRQLLLVLKYLVAEHDTPFSGDELLFEILHFEWFDIPPIEIAKATVQMATQKNKDSRSSLRQYICEKAGKPVDLFDAGIPKSLGETVSVMENLIKAVSNQTLQGLLEKVIREGGFLTHIINSPEKAWLLQLITGFYRHLKEETSRYPLTSLPEFLDRLALMNKEKLVLPLVQVSGNDKGVNLMTAHGSKGLEFDYVFVVGCNARNWEKKRKPNSGFSFPDTLFVSSAKQNEDEELRRLFYVAITRAKKYLTLSFAAYNLDGKEMEASQFLAEILEHHPLPTEKIKLDSAVVADFSILQLAAPLAPEIGQLDDELTDRIVNGFVMNVSALNNYLHCPLEFYFKNIVRIPSPTNESMAFGSAVHHALEQLFLKMQLNNNVFPSVNEFVDYFITYMHRNRESFTKEQFARRLEYGPQILANYYKTYSHQWNKIVSVERFITNVDMDDILLKGRIDKLEFNGKDVTVVDYKTGDIDYAKAKLAPPNPKIPDGGDYWRQAVFYKIMVDNYLQKDWEFSAFEFDFIEPDKKKEYHKKKVTILEEDVQTVRDQIKTVSDKIRRKDFYTGCGKKECHWCQFVKTNKMTVALHELPTEEEEGIRGKPFFG